MKESFRNNKIINAIPGIYIFLFPAFLFFILELLNPGAVSSAADLFGIPLPSFFVRAPYNDVMMNLPAVIFSVIAVYLLLALVFSLIGDIFVSSSVVSIFLYALYVVNYYRKLVSGKVLSPGDLNMASDLDTIMSFTNISVEKRVVFSAVFVVIGLVLIFFARKSIALNIRKRMILFTITLAALLLTFGTTQSQRFIFKQIGVAYNSFKMSNNHLYKNYGVMLGFYTASQQNNIDSIFDKDNHEDTFKTENDATPLSRIGAADFQEKYSDDFMRQIISGVKKDIYSSPKAIPPVEKPNVIVIMSEAFTDPTTWDNIVFSDDPVPNLHRLQETATSGNIITPEFGGNTCNPEFEFLTGFPLYFAASGDIPFAKMDTYIPRTDTRALPQIFKRNGYKTIGVHTYHGWFFNRVSVYPRLGFDNFISIEAMPDAPLKGRFTSDEYFTDKIIEQIENTEEPLFLYGISMQNHFEYYPNKFQKLDVSCTSDRLDDFQTQCADAYLQGVYDADKQLGRLIEYLEQSGKPTIVYFFGDHLPILGEPPTIHNDLDYISSSQMEDWNLDENYRMFTTPYIMWANYELPEHNWKDMSTYFIGPLILDLTGLDKNIYFDFLSNAYESFHAMKHGLYVNDDDKYYNAPLLQDKDILDDFYYLNYDYIHGKGYTANAQSEITKQEITKQEKGGY